MLTFCFRHGNDVQMCNGLVYLIKMPISFAVTGDPPLPSDQTTLEFLASNNGLTSTFWTLLEASGLADLVDGSLP